MKVPRLDAGHIRGLRLRAHALWPTSGGRPVEAVERLLAIQAQDLPGAKWSLGLRTGASESAVDADLDAGRIVRTWPLRGTLHVVRAEDAGWLLALTASRQRSAAVARHRALGLSEAEVRRAEAAVRDALAGGRASGRRDLLARIAAAVSIEGQRGYHLLWRLALDGVIVQGATDGGEQAFHLLDDWVLAPRVLVRDEALAELAARYFRSHGPASDADLARWAGIPMGEARRGRVAAGRSVATVEAEGATWHLAPEALDAPVADPGARVVHLLPGFDEYLLGYGDRSAVLAPDAARRIVKGGTFRPTVVVGGEVRGTWRLTRTSRGMSLAAEAFGEPLGREVRAGLEAAVTRLAAFLGREVRLARPEGMAPGPDGRPDRVRRS